MRRAKLISHSAVVFILGLSPGVAAFASAMPAGEWARDDGLVRARIARCGTKICATTIWAKDPKGVEKAGDRFIMTVTAANPGHWTGMAFDPQRKLEYAVDLRIVEGRLVTQGCISGSAVCKIDDWTRIRK